MLAVWLATLPYCQRNSPSLAATPITAFRSQVTYMRTPPTSAGMTDAYPAPPASGHLVVQIALPVRLSRAASAAVGPPGVQTSLSPSTSGDSLNPQPLIILPWK